MWSDSSASSSAAPLYAASRQHVKAPGRGIAIGLPRPVAAPSSPRSPRLSKQSLSDRWLESLLAVTGSGGSSCLGRPERSSRNQEEELSSRTSFADFLGVTDDEQVVTNMVLAHTAQFTYAVGCEMTHVVLPFINLTAAHGNVQSYGLYRSLTNVVQTFGGLAFGRFVDVYGVKASMLMAHAATLTYYGVVANASSQQVLFLSLLPAAAMHGFQATQMAATSSAPVEKRAKAFGHINFVYGTGFVVGTALVVLLGKVAQPQTVVLTAAGFEALVLGAMAWKMEDLTASDDQTTDVAPSEVAPEEVSPASTSEKAFLSHIFDLLRAPGVRPVLISKLCLCASGGLMLGMAPQFALDPFGLTSVESGIVMAYVGVMNLAAQASSGWFQEKINQVEGVRLGYLSPSAVAAACSGGAVAICLLGMTVPKVTALLLTSGATASFPLANVASFVFWLGPLAAAQQLAQVALTVELTTRAPKRDMGFVLGMDMSMYSLSGIVTPLAAAELVRAYGFFSVPFTGAALALVSTAGCLMIAGASPADHGASLPDEEPAEAQAESW